MEEQALQQGGAVCDNNDPTCTHLVVDDNSVKSLSFVPHGRMYVVVQEVTKLTDVHFSFLSTEEFTYIHIFPILLR